MSTSTPTDRRRFDRHVLAPMYTAVQARRADGTDILDGHAYDISEGGVRIELDEPLAPGESVSLTLRLPGEAEDVSATASVVRRADHELDFGPLQVALSFQQFASETDHQRLLGYFGRGRGVRAA